AGEVFGDQDVARAQPPHRAVTDLDVDRAAEGEHGRAAGRVMPGIRPVRVEAADDDAAAGNQLGSRRLVAARLELRYDLLEVRLTVGTGVDANDGHGISPHGV